MSVNELIKTALLGTDKYMPATPDFLGETGKKIESLSTEKEDRFLKLAITAFLYEEAGRKSSTFDSSLPECPAETSALVSPVLVERLRETLFTKEDVLFKYLTFLISKSNQVLPADLVPEVLDKARENKKASGNMVQICGETGKWLCSLNPAWQPLFQEDKDENIWETGSFENRRQYLAQIRTTDPAKAVEMLTDSIAAENASSRVGFLEVLYQNLSISDEPFLLSLEKDKSQKVKDLVLDLLRKIPGSAVSTRYFDFLRAMLIVKDERHLLVMKKKSLSIREDLQVSEDLYKSGIEKVSSDKGVQDHIFLAGQLISYTDPAVLAKKLALSEAELIALLVQHKDGKHLLPFLTRAAASFKNRTWATILIKEHGVTDVALLDALPIEERTSFYPRFFEGNLPSVLPYMLDDVYSTLSLSLSDQLLTYLARNPYHISQPGYQKLALYLPLGIQNRLKTFAEDDRQNYQDRYFKTQAAEMMRILHWS